MQRLSNKVSIVTGGASGIGEAIAIKFAGEGAKVVIADLDFKQAENVASKIVSAGQAASAYAVNVSDPLQVEQMVKSTIEKFGTIDVLVNSAGIFNFVSTEEITPADWKKILDVDLNGLFYCCLYAGKEMVKRRRGKIINVSSMAGIVGIPNAIGYVAAKHAVVGITRALAIDFGKYGINVNCLCPGTTLTPLVKAHYTKDYLETRSKVVPLGKLSDPVEQANSAVFLASSESDYVNGLIMYVDGGMFSLFSGYAPSFNTMVTDK
jgi:3-oxoacyl-[acyl-carrier protein] reductase